MSDRKLVLGVSGWSAPSSEIAVNLIKLKHCKKLVHLKTRTSISDRHSKRLLRGILALSLCAIVSIHQPGLLRSHYKDWITYRDYTRISGCLSSSTNLFASVDTSLAATPPTVVTGWLHNNLKTRSQLQELAEICCTGVMRSSLKQSDDDDDVDGNDRNVSRRKWVDVRWHARKLLVENKWTL